MPFLTLSQQRQSTEGKVDRLMQIDLCNGRKTVVVDVVSISD